ncbi:MAG: glycosyltransferase family 4 protein [Lachnospiraceae bacterium]|nr:glycosyltransferase family 4 protein [Lachnospiraceae bacterium]
MGKKHICLIDYDMCDWGGVEQVIENLGHAFLEDYRVSVVSLCSGFLREYEGISCYTIINKRARMREILVHGYWKLVQVLNQNQVDIAVVCESCAGMIVTMAKPFIKAKVIFADHLNLLSVWNDKPVWYMRYFSSRFSEHTVTLTEKNKKDYVKYFHSSPEKLTVIYNWIDKKVFDAAGEYQSDAKKILTVGRLEHAKGYDRLVDIAEKLLPQHPEWEWHIFGKGSLQEELGQQIQSRGLGKQLILMGKSEKMLEEYGKYSIFAMTSYVEGLPLALLEAKANQLPSVSFDILTGPSEIIDDGRNGYLIEDGDINSFAEKLEMLMRDELLRVSFSRQSRQGIERFQKEKILEQWKALFDAILR